MVGPEKLSWEAGDLDYDTTKVNRLRARAARARAVYMSCSLTTLDSPSSLDSHPL
jgi:hypothetical protein